MQSEFAPTVREPLPESQRKEFLEQLRNTVNRFYDEDDPDFKPVSLPEDYCALISIANGVLDADVRRSGICGIDDISHLPLDKVVPKPEKLPCHYDFKRGWDIDIGIVVKSTRDTQDWSETTCLIFCLVAT